MTTTSPSPLPPLYAGWMSQVLEGPVPAETRATCDDCAMCNPRAPADSFNPDTKCCTYVPALANFLVGRVLADEEAASAVGRESVRARIAAGVGVTPLGLMRPAMPGLLYRFGSTQGFGRSPALLCPHYVEEGGLCGIWRHRNAVCATWFCKHVRGDLGRAFWERVRQLLSAVETQLVVWCVLELGVGPDALAKLFPPESRARPVESASLSLDDLEGRDDPARRSAVWGTWAGRELEFYGACAGLVEGLDFARMLDVCGPEVRAHVELVRAVWRRLADPEPPPKLRSRHLQVVGMTEETCRVTTYSALDPLEMPRSLFDALHHFDGRPNAEALRAIVEAGGPQLTTSLVRKMADFGILVSAEDEGVV